MEQIVGVSSDKLIEASLQTMYMLSWGLFFGTLLGIPLGILLVVTRKNGIKPNRIVYWFVSAVVNGIRSLPFIILLVTISPFTRMIMGTRIGTRAALVPLIIFITPFLARLIESSLLEVDNGIIEAAQAMGASTLQIIRYFLLPEALGSIVLALTTGTIGLLGATAMAGTIGGGGIGDLLLTYGYQRFNNMLMVVTVIVLIIFVQGIQMLGNWASKKLRTHE